MRQVEPPSKLTFAWHLERTLHPSRLRKRSVLERLWQSSLDGVAAAMETAFLFGLRSIPESRSYAVAPYVGLAQRTGTRLQSLANMQTVLGRESRTATQWQELWEKHKLHVGITAIESIHFGTMNREQLLARVTVQGEEHLRAALQRGKGVMLFINHLGNLGSIPAALGPRGYDVSITGNAMPRPSLEKKITALYAHGGVKRVLVGEHLPFKAARTFRRNGVFAAFFDFTVVGRLNHWLPFGCGELNTNIGPALLAQRNQAPVLYGSCRRLPGFRHCLTIHPPLPSPCTGDRTSDALAVTQQALNRLAGELAERPEEWWPWDYAQIRPGQAPPSSETTESRPAPLLGVAEEPATRRHR
jgi:KDO2-lipid IV(A) lauroyltransferase